ncbi:uncharacterized protein LOC111704380 [Eurytemora carolleeae]|uniref:uncharacterized protein LOC111704380 n=1 Tax=Eurytemora carolleeae TaxID=1294199 RepID=UPI000C75A649|nr:uncharacterized protein LOC111704380 [Eurytemora carolleeae]|eukprot:XP_023332376.1 uncharacterized protein LOC111704380 [Eurytemora affinis]
MLRIRVAVLFFALVSQSTSSRHKRQEDDGPTQDPISAALGLPSDSDSIRNNIVDEFTCEGRTYGYYADVANECQIFHICYPVQYPDGQEEMFKWSFICPNQTVFDQASLVCSFPLDALPCEEAPNFFEGPESINARFGEVIEDTK